MSILTTKPPKINRFIAYKYKNKLNDPYNCYRLYDTKSQQIVGTMKAGIEYIDNCARPFSPNADTYKSLYIYKLNVNENMRGQGAGTALINIAKKESIRELCSGNVHLISKNTLAPASTPHLFYRKQGFSCGTHYKSCEPYFDDCIKNKTPINPAKCGTQIPMYIEKCVINQDKNIEKWYNLKIKNPSLFDRL